MPTKLILADDHPLLLNGTKEFLEKLGYHIIYTAIDGQEAYNSIIKLNPDIAILDFDMPKLNGLEIAEEIVRKNVTTKIIILTLHKQEALLNEVGKSIHGYITKDSAMQELEACINTIKSGKTYISSKLSNSIHFDTSNSENFELTVSEIKILKYLNENLSSNQIAEELFISKRTVEKHRSNIIKKLNLDSSNQNALIIWLKNHPEIFNK
ncbi:response regulator transcription factor [Corallibacter vietnamensis]|uniref:Response regulator transcription factor n=1 Tax=Corallibacter vietnamensis TaxID=904130 RepID=A0ABP7H8T3_9FLAO